MKSDYESLDKGMIFFTVVITVLGIAFIILVAIWGNKSVN